MSEGTLTFHVGDMVMVDSRIYDRINGSVGVIAAADKSLLSYGLDFSSGTIVGHPEFIDLHNLGGILPRDTGWWVPATDVVPYCPDDDLVYSLEDLESFFA